MTPFAWICQPSMIGNMVKKVIRWATGDDVEDYPDNSVDGHKCTLVELFDGDGVHREGTTTPWVRNAPDSLDTPILALQIKRVLAQL